MSRGVCLVVEDDEDISDLISLILREEGFGVRAVRTGSAALEEVSRVNPALITLDLGLPDTDGLLVARELRKVTAAPLLLITARASPTDELDGMAAGASAFLAKPFRPYELRDVANKIC
ncbi:response regulator transcription factor [Arthrobacter sp. ISL-30]|uniref:response regulator transcription factor n=1 Tax=Arthrobacter sp. ISL-30 TaxID=2819109 RepID=UPI001BEAAF52|nr:response regulator [Arthrobacter sp. ISL-30]MBT2515797.1 response regulator [Arthrobacter sp. ISL-30]